MEVDMLVGIRELKNRLTHYISLIKRGEEVVVTERGSPVAILHGLDTIEKKASIEERLAFLAKKGTLRLPLKKGKLSDLKPIKAKGKPASEIIIEERR
ncbi:MAG: hypothetical protein A2X87_01060 [Deltaproteobacteria bacterium GWC2_42_51]|nr:MAG: hypothetical protein A2056_03400 [Deltaproteobacteria bacterium GWA2_42_85]OGP34533.1 MAG: hypothetical protein A2X87_01060 [Deltaproteobacteria bacterium GWC2_42_51]OGP44074.1 MAG: hypothetical protein A2090_06150 [Deltaproteobacteria bacterium GWD2_42_10]OGP46718.1 MAG: hypothetical protein A2022_05335 [Deltaproteobacteria bacterium GWF2_42_12]OGQ26868.1 MAG: hypothetical protein A3D29_05915 [Deltaproteobacteria bacterium RIFCSPHIGHO2_02_FULL_42_44]OGQ38389.1 MAG: hypothetical protei